MTPELGLVLAGFAAIPAAMVAINLWFYRQPGLPNAAEMLPAVSVLIPARNEEASIAASVGSVLANRGVNAEVVVMDDHSTDRTADIVRDLAAGDPRVRLETAPPLPEGWNGKQHACASLAERAAHDHIVFMDADVRLAPDALARMLTFQRRSGAALVSGIPHQETRSWSEWLVIPVIHFILLGYLPLLGMRLSRRASFSAGCGQLFLASREGYRMAGGHAAIRASRHDGVTLPRAFRRAGLKTDLFDATDVATCRMYRNARQLWNGFAKNATEGMAGGAAIFPWTVLLGLGHVAPWILLPVARLTGGANPSVDPWFGLDAAGWCAVAIALGLATRFSLAWRFRQSWVGALLHPLGVAATIAIQWYAWGLARLGRDVAWKGRVRTGH